jgi:hypothetical protein
MNRPAVRVHQADPVRTSGAKSRLGDGAVNAEIKRQATHTIAGIMPAAEVMF